MGACHQLLARQKTIFKQYSIKGYQLCVADAERAAVGSVRAVVEGHHYYCNMGIKDILVLVQYRAEDNNWLQESYS